MTHLRDLALLSLVALLIVAAVLLSRPGGAISPDLLPGITETTQ